MTGIVVAPELWACSVLPEGILERWLKRDGEAVRAGEAVAAVRVESALHALVAPASGRLTIASRINDVVEPGSVIGHVRPARPSRMAGDAVSPPPAQMRIPPPNGDGNRN